MCAARSLPRPGARNRRSPISTRRSASIPITRRPMPIAACSTAKPASLIGACRLQQGAGDRRLLRARLSRPRHRLSPARPQHAGAQRLQQSHRAQAEQRAGLLQSRPALSGPASGPNRDRRLHHGHRARHAEGGAARGAGAQLPRGRRRQARRRLISTRRCRSAAPEPAGLGQPRARLRAPRQKEKAAGSYARRSTSTKNTSRRAPALPVSAEGTSRTRRSEHPGKVEAGFPKRSRNLRALRRKRNPDRALRLFPHALSFNAGGRAVRPDRRRGNGRRHAARHAYRDLRAAVEETHEVLRRLGQLEQPLAHRVGHEVVMHAVQIKSAAIFRSARRSGIDPSSIARPAYTNSAWRRSRPRT